jgi:hypothetical protein
MASTAIALPGQGPAPLLAPGLWVYSGSFRENVKAFLESQGREVALAVPHTRCWFVSLSDGTQLQVYAEEVQKETVVCDQCRIIGECARASAAVRAGLRGPPPPPPAPAHTRPDNTSTARRACRLGHPPREPHPLPLHRARGGARRRS